MNYFNSKDARLISLVQRNNQNEAGDFVNIYLDLRDFSGQVNIDELEAHFENNNECSNLIKMAYGYASRTLFAGMLIQGATSIEDYEATRNIFFSLQHATDPSESFQIKAFEQANELIQSYSYLLDEDTCTFITRIVELHRDDMCPYRVIVNFPPTMDVIGRLIRIYNESNDLLATAQLHSSVFESVIADDLILKLETREVAYQFILEEIEAASYGNAIAQRFAFNSGIAPNKYSGAMNNSMPEVDGPGGPQQLFVSLFMQLKDDPSLMVNFRISVVKKLMSKLKIGNY